jgi:hypothetical protein
MGIREGICLNLKTMYPGVRQADGIRHRRAANHQAAGGMSGAAHRGWGGLQTVASAPAALNV